MQDFFGEQMKSSVEEKKYENPEKCEHFSE